MSPVTDRGVSSTLNYVLSLGIMAILVTGLLSAGGAFVEDRQEQVIQSELEVIGQQVASDIQRADRLVTAGDGDQTVELTQTLPEEISGSRYSISLDSGSSELILSSDDPERSVTIRLQTTTSLGDSTVDGGSVRVVYDSGPEELVVTNG